MADPLSLLRQYNVSKKEIIEKDGMIFFGEYCWAKNVKSNYLIYCSSRDGHNKSYYTLECLLYLLKNIQLQHPAYVKQAASLDIPVVQRLDRKDLLAYLSGESAVSASIDKSAPIELPKSASQLNKQSVCNQHGGGLSFGGSGAQADDDGPRASKLARLDEMEMVRKKSATRLDAPKLKEPSDLSASPMGSDQADGPVSSLRDTLSSDQIAALKAKRLAKKRNTIIDAETDGDEVQGSELNKELLQTDSNFTKEIQSKERIYRNRTNFLQRTGKNFRKTIFPILQSISIREEIADEMRKPVDAPLVRGRLSGRVGGAKQYNRYRQERFAKPDVKEWIGFNIDTTSTYHGQTLKSMAEDSVALPKTPLTGSNALEDGCGDPRPPFTCAPKSQRFLNYQIDTVDFPPKILPTPSVQNVSDSGHRSNDLIAQGMPYNYNYTVLQDPPKPPKRVSRTPIIIIPATYHSSSLITMFNAKTILEDLKFIDSKACDQRRDNELLIQRRKADNTTVPYRIVDNALNLAPDDWTRVVAVFVRGPAWQFKGWPWQGNPVKIFARIKAFHLKFDEMLLDNNVAKWSVEIIELSRSKPHFNRANLLKFWSQLDRHIAKHKHNVVRY